jgi:hypothetical protein
VFPKRIVVLDLLAEVPGHRFSEAELAVRVALDRYLKTSVHLRNVGWLERVRCGQRWLSVQAQLGQNLLDIESVIQRSDEHQRAFRGILSRLPPESPYRNAWSQLRDA